MGTPRNSIEASRPVPLRETVSRVMSLALIRQSGSAPGLVSGQVLNHTSESETLPSRPMRMASAAPRAGLDGSANEPFSMIAPSAG